MQTHIRSILALGLALAAGAHAAAEQGTCYTAHRRATTTRTAPSSARRRSSIKRGRPGYKTSVYGR